MNYNCRAVPSPIGPSRMLDSESSIHISECIETIKTTLQPEGGGQLDFLDEIVQNP